MPRDMNALIDEIIKTEAVEGLLFGTISTIIHEKNHCGIKLLESGVELVLTFSACQILM